MRISLIPNWRDAWKWSSIRFAAIVSAIAGFFVSTGYLSIPLIAFIPSREGQIFAAIVFCMFLFVIPALLRITKIGASTDETIKP